MTYNGSATAPSAAGSYPVVATLTNDNYSASPASDTLAILLASAGANQTVNENTLVTLTGTGYGVTYSWTQVSPASPVIQLSSPSSPQTSFTAPNLAGGIGGATTFTFTFTAADGGVSTSSPVNVTVVNVDHAPVAVPGPNQTVNEGSLVTLNGSFSYDPDVDPITYQWQQTGGSPMVTLTGANTNKAAFTAPVLAGGVGGPLTLTFSLTVSDGVLSDTQSVTVTVDQVDHPPTANAGPPQTVNVGSPVTLDGTMSSDPDNDPIVSYNWTQTAGPSVALNTSNPAKPTFIAPASAGTLAFKLVVSDGVLSSTNTAQVNISVVDANPRCSQAYASSNVLWPPNHQLVSVSILGVTDPSNEAVTIAITGVTQDEPTNGTGDGDTGPDAVIQGSTALLRAERSGNGDGRVYKVYFTATDQLGTPCTGFVTVGVPHDQGNGKTPIDSGQQYNSLK